MSADTTTAHGTCGPFLPQSDKNGPHVLSRPPVRTIALGTAGSVLMLASSYGAAALPARIFPSGPLTWLHYGHGRMLSSPVIYLGFVMLVWAWVRLGRYVLDGQVGSRPVLIAAALWTFPMLLAPALFTRDVYSYLAQGALALGGFDPYADGPTALGPSSEIVRSVHPFWADTPAPYGPLFILLVKGVAWVSGSNVMVGVILSRLVLLPGLAMLLWALPGLTRHLGGRLPVALWLVVAGPMTVVHLVGGPHNDLLMIGFLAAGTLLALDGRHVLGIALVTLGVAVKATAVIALPFLVWVWAGHLPSGWRGVVRAIGCALAVFVSVFGACTLIAGVDLGWIGMLNSSSRIVNWLSLPTAAGEFLHWLVALVVDVNKDYFVTATRLLGMLTLAVVLARQWWLARSGGSDAVRRAAIALFAVAILSPTTLPWYLTWGMALAACLPWRRPQLAVVVGLAAFLVVTYTPDGETMLYEWPFMLAAIALSALAGISLLRPDPLSVGRTR